MTNAADSKFAVAFVVNAILAVVFLAFFLIFRKRVPRVYEPRCLGGVHNKLGENSEGAEDVLLPPSPPSSLFGWVVSTIKYKDDTLLRSHGLDAMMFIKFLKMMICIIGLQAVYGIVILFAVNATGENTNLKTDDPLFVDGLNRLSMAGVGIGSARLVAHLLSVVFNSAVVYYFSHKLYNEYMRQRIHLKTSTTKKENYVVMVREIPLSVVTDAELKEYFDKLYPNKVVGVVRTRNTPELEKKLAQRNVYMRNLEKATCIFQKTTERPTNKDKCLVGNVVDSMEWFGKKLTKKTETIEQMQAKEWPITGVAFIIFSDQATALQCGQTILHAENKYIPSPAPEPNNIAWSKLSIGHYNRLIRTTIVNVFIFFLVFFWTIPVTFVSGLSHLDNLKEIPGFEFVIYLLETSPVIIGFVEGFLPSLAIIIFFALLVMIITTVADAQGLYTKSRLSQSVMSKYFVFQVFNIFLIYSIAGSIFGVIQDIINNPTIVVSLLATSLPQQYVLFVNYIMILSLSGHTMSLWRPGPLIVRFIKHKFLCKAPKEFREAEAPGFFKYEIAYATHLLVLLIVLTYSTLAPFILIWATLYYAMAYISSKYNIVYVFDTQYESGGTHWPLVFNRMCVGLLIYQLVLVGEFAIYKFTAGIVVAAVCCVATLIFWKYTLDQYSRSAEFGALDVFSNPESYKKTREDIKLEVRSYNSASDSPEKNAIISAYQQPALVKVLSQPEFWEDGASDLQSGASSSNGHEEPLLSDEEQGKTTTSESENESVHRTATLIE